jgi:hypothetical protein
MRSSRFHRKHTATGSKPPVAVINPHTLLSPIYLDPAKYTETDSSSSSLAKEKRYFLQVATIDPGSVQCGFRVEREWESGEVTTVMMYKIDFTRPLDGSVPPSEEVGPFYHYHNIVRFIENYIHILENCQYIGIESQMEFAPQNVRLEQTFITSLIALLKNKGCRPIILILDSSLKTTGLGAPKFAGLKGDGTNPPAGRSSRVKIEGKKWCLATALRLLNERGDPQVKIFDKLPLDQSYDMGDCVCYGEIVRRLVKTEMYRIPLPELEG